MVAFALDRLAITVLDFNGVTTVRSWTPTQSAAALDKAIGDEMLIFKLDLRVLYQVPAKKHTFFAEHLRGLSHTVPITVKVCQLQNKQATHMTAASSTRMSHP